MMIISDWLGLGRCRGEGGASVMVSVFVQELSRIKSVSALAQVNVIVNMLYDFPCSEQ